ncbi:MAG: O-antigen ligase family protein [Candidatus Magasanikbacteria bacterium]
MQKKLEYLIKILIGATFFVPLIIIPGSYIFPFIVPKIIWFRTLVMLMLGVYLLLLSSNWQKYCPKLNFLNIVVLLFYLSFAISTFTGVDWYRSFWDNHERMLGLFTITHYVLYYFITTSVVKGWDEWKWLMRVFLFAGGLVMFTGFLQTYVNHDLLLNGGVTARVSATLGNSIYFSGYGLFLMFVGFLLAIKEYAKKGSLRLCSGWFWFAVIVGLLSFWGVFGGGTRGALLGLITGLGILMISYLFSLKEHKKIRRGLGGLIILGIILMGLLFNFRQTDFVKSIPAVGRLVNTQIFGGTASTRIMAWSIAVDAWQERPIFGWGPNNYYYAYNKYYRSEFLEHGWGETWFDNAHSVVMNTLAVQGGVGIILYFGIYIVAIIMLWKKYRARDIDAHIVSVGSAFLIAHLISLVTVFENPTSYLYFFFFLAFVNSAVSRQPSAVSNEMKNSKPFSWGLTVIVAFIILLLIYSTNINPARANKATLVAIRNLQAGRNFVDSYDVATSIPSPHIDDIRNDFSNTSAQVIIQSMQKNENIKIAEMLYDLTSGELKKNIDLHPLDIRIHIRLAQLLMSGAQIKRDISLLSESERLLEYALSQSPKRQQIQYTLSALKVQINKTDEAIKLLQDSIDDDPKIGEGWWRMALIYQQTGDVDKAKEILQEAVDEGAVFDEQGKSVANSILGLTKF